MSLETGHRLGRYEILAPLGAGGMGEVYRARDTELERDVAIKVLPESAVEDPDRLARFEREARAAGTLDHPNIMTVHDIDRHEGVPFIVVEILEGESLRELLARGPVPPSKAAEYGVQIARGLAAAHEKGVVHRDLKPDNLFLTRHGQVKILDFGLAKLQPVEVVDDGEARTASIETRSGTILGTVGYMSPEQVRGDAADARSDIFALGCVLYELLSGSGPFRSDTPADTMSAILRDDPPPLSRTSGAAPPALEGIVRRCLEKRPEDRFSAARDLGLALEAVATSSDVRVPERTGPRLSRPIAFVPVLLGSAVVAALLVIAYLGVIRGGDESGGPGVAHRIVVLPFENMGTPEDAYFADGMTEELTSRLSAVSGLRVISRMSAVQYAGADKSIQEMGEELDVEYVLEGTVRWARDAEGPSRIRITPQLIRVADDSVLWTEAIDDVIDDVFGVQTEIARRVADRLNVTLLARELELFEQRPTDNVDAYHAFLRGRHLAADPHFTYENWYRVVEAYERATELDPTFALAQAELARAQSLMRFYRHDLSQERLDLATTAAERAIALAPESPRVHLALGYYHLWAHRNQTRALEEFELAGKGLPNSAEILEAQAMLYQVQGRWEDTLAAYRRAFELSPLYADYPAEIAAVLWVTRQYPEAIEAANEAIELAPDAVWPYLYKAFIYWSWSGSTDEARPVLEALPGTAGGWERWAWYWQEMFQGRYHEALDLLAASDQEWLNIKICARPNALLSAYAYELLGQEANALDSYRTARVLLEAELPKQPDDPRLHSSLGIAYAALGQRAEATQAGRRATELLTREQDGFYYLPFVVDLAHIYTIVGRHDLALEQLDYLLSNPSWISVPYLEMDPRWNALREDPRFSALLERYREDQ
jgi:TolB-like protein/tetratricopeptide (TPR) repeat protein